MTPGFSTTVSYKAPFPVAHPPAPPGAPPAAPALRSQRRPLDGGGWPCGLVLGDGLPARLGLLGRLGGDYCLGAESNAMSAVEEAMSAAEKLLQRWRRCGGLRLGTVVQRETGAHACGRAAGVLRACRTLPWRGVRHTGSRGTRWGGWAGRRTAMPPQQQRGNRRRRTRRQLPGTGQRPTRRGQAADQAKASWRRRAGAIRGGSAARFRCRRIVRITSPCVRAAMIRSAPC